VTAAIDTTAGLIGNAIHCLVTRPEWLARLRAWDGDAAAGRREPTVFAAWYDALAEHLYADELGPLFAAYRGQRAAFVAAALGARDHWCDDVATPRTERCPEILGAALSDALDRLTGALGPPGPRWAWGRQHPAVFEHRFYAALGPLGALARAELARGGDDSSVNAASPAAPARPPLFPRRHGVSYRQIVVRDAATLRAVASHDDD